MESRWTLKTLESDFKGQNSISYGVLYIIGNFLERRCLKWACISHFDIWNTSYGQKKGQESNCQFDSWPQKVRNRPDLVICKGRATYRWKALDDSYNVALDRISIRGLLAKLWGSKVAKVPSGAISGVLGEKSHLDLGSMASHKVNYKGEGGGFPHVQAVVSLVCPCSPWLVLAPRVLQLCTNHLMWVVCRPVWVNEACQLFLVPSRSSNTPLYPSKCCELRSVPQLLPLPLFYTWTHIWVLWGVGSASSFTTKTCHLEGFFFFRSTKWRVDIAPRLEGDSHKHDHVNLSQPKVKWFHQFKCWCYRV
jgi:hypothetical protein